MRHLNLLAGLLAAGTLLAGGPAHAQDEAKFWRIGTGSSGGTYYPVGGLISQAISNPPGARPCEEGGSCGVTGLVAIAQSTNASAHNVNAVQAGQLEAGLAEAGVVYMAYRGEGPFEGHQKPDLRAVAGLFPEHLHLVLHEDVSLDSLQDLKGKRVGIFQAGSGSQIAVRAILDEFGLGLDDIEEAELNTQQSAQRLADGQLDAFFVTGGTPMAGLVQLGATQGFDLYRFSDEEVQRISDALPYYTPATIEAGTYENIDSDVPTTAVTAVLVTNADQPDELIHDVTRALFHERSQALFADGHPKAGAITMDTALDGVAIPLHPGAQRFYEEEGMTIKDAAQAEQAAQ